MDLHLGLLHLGLLVLHGILLLNWLLNWLLILNLGLLVLHLGLHFLVPGLVAWFAFKSRWQYAWMIMVLTMLVDLDHLLASPIFDPNRCSIGFHPLHTYPAIASYLALVFIPVVRLVAIGLLIHMGLDASDCARMSWFG